MIKCWFSVWLRLFKAKQKEKMWTYELVYKIELTRELIRTNRLVLKKELIRTNVLVQKI